MNTELANQISVVSSISAEAVTAVTDGAGVNLADFNAATVIVNLGTFAGTTPTATVEIEESADNATFTAVAATDLTGAIPAQIDTTNDATVYKVGYKGSKQYIRVTVSAIAGAGASLPISATVIRSHGRKYPAS